MGSKWTSFSLPPFFREILIKHLSSVTWHCPKGKHNILTILTWQSLLFQGRICFNFFNLWPLIPSMLHLRRDSQSDPHPQPRTSPLGTTRLPLKNSSRHSCAQKASLLPPWVLVLKRPLLLPPSKSTDNFVRVSASGGSQPCEGQGVTLYAPST